MLPGLANAQTNRPDYISEADWAKIEKLVDTSKVKFSPYDGNLAKKPDGTPYKVLQLITFLGDDYQVVASNVLKTQLESAGAEYTLLSADLSAATQNSAMESAIATRAYDAIVLQPIDSEAVKVLADRAAEAGIDVYNFVQRVQADSIAGSATYEANSPEANGQIGAKFLELAKAEGATPEKPFRVLEIWGLRSMALSVGRGEGFRKGIGDSGIVEVVQSVDTSGRPEAVIKAIQDAFARYPDIKGIYPHWGDASAFIEGLRSVDRLAPPGDPKHVVVILQDIDKAMLPYLRDGTIDYTVSNGPWHQMDVLVKQILWHTVLKQPLAEGDALSGNVKLPKHVLLPMPLLSGKNIDTPEGQLWGGTVAFPDLPFGKWDHWPVLDTTTIGLPIPTIEDRKQLLGY
jgi:ABC-type sugar transport system substrate-binding protein